MKPFKLKKDSWHFWLATFGDKNRVDHRYGDDICHYIRSVLVGAFWATFALVAASLFTAWVGFSFGNLIGWLFFGYVLDLATVFFFMFAAFIGALVGWAAFMDWRREHCADREPGFVTLAYRKFKTKTCAMVEFE